MDLECIFLVIFDTWQYLHAKRFYIEQLLYSREKKTSRYRGGVPNNIPSPSRFFFFFFSHHLHLLLSSFSQ